MGKIWTKKRKVKYSNKEFDLFGAKYTIEYTDKIEAEEGLFRSGTTNPAAHKITLAKLGFDGGPMDKSTAHITLLHELIHAILDEGQYHNSSADEPMVEWLARCLHSLITQKII